MTRSGSEQRRASRTRLLARGAAAGALAFGVPALANALIARRAVRMEPAPPPGGPRWSGESWESPLGEMALHRAGGGRRRPAVFLHSYGPGHSSRQWAAVGELLSHRRPVLLVDDLGWGDSDRPSAPYGLETSVDLLELLLEERGERVDLVASGESAPLALTLAARSDAVASVALSGPAGLRLHPTSTGTRDRLLDLVLMAPILGRSALNAYTRRDAIADHLIKHLGTPPQEEEVDHHYRLAHLPGSEHALTAFLRGHYERRLAELATEREPRLWIGWGRRAAGEPVEDADLWLHHLPDAELTVFERSASWPHVDQPRVFDRELRRFLD